MPKDREKSINPAAAQRKAEKQKALKKGIQAQSPPSNSLTLSLSLLLLLLPLEIDR